jgi:hypothetical protein
VNSSFFFDTKSKEPFCALIPLDVVYQSALYLLCLPCLKYTDNNQALIPKLTQHALASMSAHRIFSPCWPEEL